MTYMLVSHLVDKSPDSNGFTSVALNTSGADLIVVALAEAGAIGGTLTDSNSNTWTQLTPQTINGDHQSAIWYSRTPTVVGAAQTFIMSGTGNFPAICVAAFSGSLTGSNPFDQQNGATIAFQDHLGTGSIAPTGNEQLLIACVQFNTVNLAAMTIDDPAFTVTDSTADHTFGHQGIALAYSIQHAASTAAPAWSYSDGNTLMTTNIASFKPGSLTGLLPTSRGGH